ncbi:tRNA lysidine(34) synthetase TilS [bacterium]|nr:tRNA lysidine(34) synthetase TilS [bacterium]
MKNKNVISNVEIFLKQYNLTASTNNLAVAFSGGFDSMCLLHCLIQLRNQYKFNLYAFHLNHNWRKEESLNEANRCKEFCQENDVTFYTETLSEFEKHTETRARELRYEFFKRAIEKFNITALFTAHTKSDISETVIYRIIKGTGIKGLCGISPNINKIYRPILDVSRCEIEQYCNENNLLPNNDSSNAKNDYSRNFIRNEILPKFKKINTNYEQAISSLANLAFESEEIVKEYISLLGVYDNFGKINSCVYKNLSNNLKKRIIYELFVKNDFEYTQQRVLNVLTFIKENINKKSGNRCSLTNNYWLFVNTEKIYVISRKEKIQDEIKILKEGIYDFGEFVFSIKKCDNMPIVFPKDSEYKAYINLTEDINFVLRTRRNGDVIQPLGTKGTMKFKKYLINKNIPQHKKDDIVLLCKSNEVLWASGLGISEKIKVVNNCTHVIELRNKE